MLVEALRGDGQALQWRGEDAGLFTLSAGDAGLWVDHACSGLRIDLQRVHRANRQAGCIWALHADVLEELSALAKVCGDLRVARDRVPKVNANPRQLRNPADLRHLGAVPLPP